MKEMIALTSARSIFTSITTDNATMHAVTAYYSFPFLEFLLAERVHRRKITTNAFDLTRVYNRCRQRNGFWPVWACYDLKPIETNGAMNAIDKVK